MFVVLMPNSNTNHSDQYRVVDANDWQRYVNGATISYSFVSVSSYEEAERVKNEANLSHQEQ